MSRGGGGLTPKTRSEIMHGFGMSKVPEGFRPVVLGVLYSLVRANIVYSTGEQDATKATSQGFFVSVIE